MPNAEEARLAEDARRVQNWKRWGPYLPERQWGTVRETTRVGDCWSYLPTTTPAHAPTVGARMLLGLTDREGRLCFALSLWNGTDPILKERLFDSAAPKATTART